MPSAQLPVVTPSMVGPTTKVRASRTTKRIAGPAVQVTAINNNTNKLPTAALALSAIVPAIHQTPVVDGTILPHTKETALRLPTLPATTDR